MDDQKKKQLAIRTVIALGALGVISVIVFMFMAYYISKHGL